MHRVSCLMISLMLMVVASAQTPTNQRLVTIPQGFEPNHGQMDSAVDFISHGPGYSLTLNAGSANLQLVTPAADGKSADLRFSLVGAAHGVRGEGVRRQTGKSNYFLGNAPELWLTDIPQFGRVEYHGVYPGIDLAYYGDNQRLEYDFILGPHADPGKIRFAVDGASRIQIDPAGDLVLTVGSAEIRERRPLIYQETRNGRSIVDGRYIVLDGDQVGFEVGNYDIDSPLVIDPVLIFSTYFGGSGIDQALGVALDSIGNIYVCGPVGAGSFQGNNFGHPSFTGSNLAAYVAKLSPSGALLSSTFIAGTNDQAACTAIALDVNGNIYLAGNTTSASFPVVSGVQPVYGGGAGDAFALELNNAGNVLIYSTYLGGSGLEAADGIGVDANGNTLVTGWTASKNFPVLNAFQGKSTGTQNAFAVKLVPSGTSFVYSTYLGGSGSDYNNGLTLDSSGDLILFGDTTSPNFPVLNAFQPNFCGWIQGQKVSNPHGWVAKLDPIGAPVYSSYICGSAAADAVRGGVVDTAGNLILTGGTGSLTFPVLNPIQATFGGGVYDVFVTKLSPTGALLSSTYLGGSGTDVGRGITLDQLGNVYVIGSTSSGNFPTVSPTQNKLGGSTDAFLTKLNAAESAIAFSTYIGGAGDDYGWDVAVDGHAYAYISGFTSSANFPTLYALQPTYGGGSFDAFLTAIATCSFTFSSSSTFGAAGGTGSVSITTTPECGWTVTSQSSWITVTSSPATGQGSGSAAFSVDADSSGNRQGSLTIGGQTVSIGQNGVSLLSVAETHAGSFTQGQMGAAYVVAVGNGASAGPTTGTVVITQTLPAGLTLVSMIGTGWNCAGATCSRSDVLTAGASYPPVTVKVNVAANAGTPLVAQVTLSGGGLLSPVTASDSTTIANGAAPAMSVAETNAVSFTQGQAGASYTVIVSNGAAAGPTLGAVTLTQTFATGLTLVSMTGTGWSCVGANCTRSDVLNPGASYPQVTVTVNVATNAGTPLLAQVTVSGGGSATATATDSTVIIPVPVLSVSETNAAAFTQGQLGAVYSVNVGNGASAVPTTGTVVLTQTLPAGLTLASMSGAGWTCSDATCTRSDVLTPGASYPTVTVTVNVAANAGTPLLAQVTVSGGGALTPATATDSTSIALSNPPVFTVVEANAAGFTQGQAGASYTVTVGNVAGAGPTSGTVTLTQVLPAGLILVSMTGTGWACTGATCIRSDVLSPGANYPPVTVSVNVAANATTPQTSQVSVSGGGAATATATDATAIQYVTTLAITNQGPDAMSFTGLQLIGFVGTQTNNCPVTIGVNASCNFTMTFAPNSFTRPTGVDWANFGQYAAADQQLITGAPDPARLVFIGDSITYYWDQPSPYGANSLSNVRPFVNRGSAGQTTEQLLVRFQEDVVKLHPAVVHIFGGTNDMGGNTGPETSAEIIDQIASMTQVAQANGIKVLIASVTPVIDTQTNTWTDRRPNASIRALNQSIQAYCQQSGAVYVDYYSVLADSNGNMNINLTVDGLHPNTTGFAAMVPVALQALAKLGY